MPSTLGLFDVVSIKMKEKIYLKIIIASGTEKPYYLKKYGMVEKGCLFRIGSATESMSQNMIEHLFASRIRNSIRKIKSPKSNLMFNQLKIYYQERGFELNAKFTESLELLTEDNQYNYAAYLLADENGMSIKVAKYDGLDRCELIENNEYGYCSIVKVTNLVLEKLKVENRTLTKITGDSQRKEKN